MKKKFVIFSFGLLMILLALAIGYKMNHLLYKSSQSEHQMPQSSTPLPTLLQPYPLDTQEKTAQPPPPPPPKAKRTAQPRPLPSKAKRTAQPPPPPPTSLERVEVIRRNLERGNIAFNTPQKMKLKETKIIELLLSPIQSPEELQSLLQSAEKAESASIKISNVVQANLSGTSGLDIKSLKPERQAISRGQITKWIWEVTPKSGEKQNLYLTVSAIINLPGESVPLVIKTYEKTIEVEVSIDQRISTFMANNWQWLGTSILIPLVPFLWKWYQDKQKTKRSPQHLALEDEQEMKVRR